MKFRFLGLMLRIVIPLLVWLAVNQFVPTYLIPTPSSVVQAIADVGQTIPYDLFVTSIETIAGLLLALFVSLTLAVTFYFFRPIESIVMPYAVALKAVPVVAMAPLLVIWAGNGLPAKIILAAIVSFFPLLIGIRDGLHSKPTELDHVAQIWARSSVDVLLHIDLPLSLPSALSALKIAAPLSLVGAVVAEFSGANSGLGHLIIVAAYRADVSLLVAGILIVSALGIALFQAAVVIELFFLKSMRLSRAN